MAKSALEKALEKHQKEVARNLQKQIQADKRLADGQMREASRQERLEARRTRAASIVNGQPVYGSVKIVDPTAEELLSILCSGYRREDYTITNEDVKLPDYMQNDLELEFEKLKQYGLISDYSYNVWGSWEINILPCMLSYIQNKENAIVEEKEKQKQIQIATINAPNGNVVIGDVINSSLTIDNSIHRIQEMIDEKGGDDKEILSELLDEFKEILENIEETRHIPKNKGFMNRVSSHLSKHGWFYAEIVGLLGSIGVRLLMG